MHGGRLTVLRTAARRLPCRAGVLLRVRQLSVVNLRQDRLLVQFAAVQADGRPLVQ